MKTFRHGDVQLIAVDGIPDGAKSLGERKMLAAGEKTGHSHAVDLGELFEDRNGVLYLKVQKKAKLKHEEHSTKTLAPGVYRIGIKRQYLPDGGWANVQD